MKGTAARSVCENELSKSSNFLDFCDISAYKAESAKGRRYLAAVGDGRHGDAVLVGDVVGAVVGGTGSRARGAAACRVWPGEEEKHRQARGCWSPCVTVCVSLTCHVQGALLGGGDGAVSPSQQRAAPPLAHLLLQS